ncbi:sugar phosphate isomerase/epimerase family protein [Paenibacillus glycanilyticus]|uniref:sugar phosphate isomerase/epimerase family protein n=1 Tax=Paenibacillus glycanilyticus TaxID=126569 RepID=UPI003EBC9251
MKFALAMYTVYEEMKRDLDATLGAVREMGYEGIEMYGETLWPASVVKELIAKHGLELCGWHVEWRLLQLDTLENTIRYHAELGNPNIIIPCLGGPWNVGHMPEDNHAATWLRYAEQMNELADRLEMEGMRLGYHTHAHEFHDSFDGITPWNILIEHTKPSVFLELDTGNCLEGAGDPVIALTETAGRLRVVHCKPLDSKQGTEAAIAADGDLNDWPLILQRCKAGGCEWLAIENESRTRGSKLAVAEQDLKSLISQLREAT